MESNSKGETLIKEFLALVDESIKESSKCHFLKGLKLLIKQKYKYNYLQEFWRGS